MFRGPSPPSGGPGIAQHPALAQRPPSIRAGTKQRHSSALVAHQILHHHLQVCQNVPEVLVEHSISSSQLKVSSILRSTLSVRVGLFFPMMQPSLPPFCSTGLLLGAFKCFSTSPFRIRSIILSHSASPLTNSLL